MNHPNGIPTDATTEESRHHLKMRTPAPTEFRETRLHRACMENQLEKAKLLIEDSAEIHAKDQYGNTPLHRACDWYVNCNREPPDCNAQLEITKLLLQNGADVNATNNHGDTPLHLVCSDFEHDNLETALLLTKNGAHLNAKDSVGKTPLHHACEYGHWKLVKLLLCQGANINVETKDGTTPLLMACDNDHEDTVWFLVRHHYQEVVLQ